MSPGGRAKKYSSLRRPTVKPNCWPSWTTSRSCSCSTAWSGSCWPTAVWTRPAWPTTTLTNARPITLPGPPACPKVRPSRSSASIFCARPPTRGRARFCANSSTSVRPEFWSAPVYIPPICRRRPASRCPAVSPCSCADYVTTTRFTCGVRLGSAARARRCCRCSTSSRITPCCCNHWPVRWPFIAARPAILSAGRKPTPTSTRSICRWSRRAPTCSNMPWPA